MDLLEQIKLAAPDWEYKDFIHNNSHYRVFKNKNLNIAGESVTKPILDGTEDEKLEFGRKSFLKYIKGHMESKVDEPIVFMAIERKYNIKEAVNFIRTPIKGHPDSVLK